MNEPRYTLTDTETGKQFKLSTDELQWALWLAEKYMGEKEAGKDAHCPQKQIHGVIP